MCKKQRLEARIVTILTDVALDSNKCGNAKIAACLVLDNEIISIATNIRKTHPFQKRYAKNSDSIFLHAETHCLTKALKKVSIKDLERAEMWVVRTKESAYNEFEYGLAKPCIGCKRAIADFKIKKVNYTIDDTHKAVFEFL